MINRFKITYSHSSWESEVAPMKGELIYEADTGVFRIGDGETHYQYLPILGTYFVDENGNQLADLEIVEKYFDERLNESIVCVDDLL